ncbi:MAG TPA: FeoA family protein [Synergistaceae bacterium]|jgi:Fe2+ transport system protein FeoA|nr:MAG: ferrous iron transport protein A [Synergistetes bacterium ADurb.Bin520]HQK25791.1 FeoA family protein [Synergistaceae bacterium]
MDSPCKAETPLDELDPGEMGVVVRVEGDPSLRKRVLDMGLVPGTPLVVERKAPFNDPVSVRFRGYELGLRCAEARSVLVRRLSMAPCSHCGRRCARRKR